MPNHVKNVLKFKNLSFEDKQFILNNFTKEIKDEVYPLNLIFDFNKITPEPKTETECPDDYKVNKDSCISVYEDRPWFDWYKWHMRYWNTKWNCYDGYISVNTSAITFVFNTAWSAPYPIYEQLAKKYKFNFEVYYADEDWGSNCGKIIYDPKSTGFEDFVHICNKDLADSRSFARKLWNNY